MLAERKINKGKVKVVLRLRHRVSTIIIEPNHQANIVLNSTKSSKRRRAGVDEKLIKTSNLQIKAKIMILIQVYRKNKSEKNQVLGKLLCVNCLLKRKPTNQWENGLLVRGGCLVFDVKINLKIKTRTRVIPTKKEVTRMDFRILIQRVLQLAQVK